MFFVSITRKENKNKVHLFFDCMGFIIIYFHKKLYIEKSKEEKLKQKRIKKLTN